MAGRGRWDRLCRWVEFWEQNFSNFSVLKNYQGDCLICRFLGATTRNSYHQKSSRCIEHSFKNLDSEIVGKIVCVCVRARSCPFSGEGPNYHQIHKEFHNSRLLVILMSTKGSQEAVFKHQVSGVRARFFFKTTKPNHQKPGITRME